RPRSAGASATCSEPGSGPATPRRCPCEERRAPSADCRLLDGLRQPQELRRELVPLAARPPEVDEYDGLPLRAVERDAHLAPLRPGRNARDGQRLARGAQLLEARRERAWHEIDDRAGGERGAELARSRDGGMQARLAERSREIVGRAGIGCRHHVVGHLLPPSEGAIVQGGLLEETASQ